MHHHALAPLSACVWEIRYVSVHCDSEHRPDNTLSELSCLTYLPCRYRKTESNAMLLLLFICARSSTQRSILLIVSSEDWNTSNTEKTKISLSVEREILFLARHEDGSMIDREETEIFLRKKNTSIPRTRFYCFGYVEKHRVLIFLACDRLYWITQYA